MARNSSKKPRIRKVAPTVRELAEEATQAAADVKPSKANMVKSGFGKLFRPLRPAGRILKKILGWLVPRYFINSWREVRQVTWPSRRETWRLTLAVGIFAAVFGSIVFAVDKGLDDLFKNLVLK